MMRVTTALFAQDSEVDFLNAFKAARHGGGTDDFSVIVLTGTPQLNRLHFLQFHQRLVGVAFYLVCQPQPARDTIGQRIRVQLSLHGWNPDCLNLDL